MIIRKIKPEELKRTFDIFSIAFEFGAENEKSAMEIYEEISRHPKSREEAYWSERWAAFEEDDCTMMGYLIAQPFPVQFDGNRYTMTGIGGVASLPQYRKNGCIRRCFEAALPAMHEDGITFSYLYPFSTAFYRKFGYEIGCECFRYHIRLNSLQPFPVNGSCSLVEKDYPKLSQIQQIYRAWQNQYNMMVMNEEYEFNWVKKSDPVKDQTFTYVYESKEHVPMGYMSVNQVNEQDGRNLLCTRFCFTCVEGLKGLLNLLISLGTDHSYVTVELPTDIDMGGILPEWSGGTVSIEKNYLGMVRVVNAEKVLLGARYQGSGQIVIKISDRQIRQNEDTFEVIFKEGRAVSVRRDETAKPDVSMEIHDFSRLILGTCEVSGLQYMDGVEIHNPSACVGQIFYKKPNYIMEHF